MITSLIIARINNYSSLSTWYFCICVSRRSILAQCLQQSAYVLVYNTSSPSVRPWALMLHYPCSTGEKELLRTLHLALLLLALLTVEVVGIIATATMPVRRRIPPILFSTLGAQHKREVVLHHFSSGIPATQDRFAKITNNIGQSAVNY